MSLFSLVLGCYMRAPLDKVSGRQRLAAVGGKAPSCPYARIVALTDRPQSCGFSFFIPPPFIQQERRIGPFITGLKETCGRICEKSCWNSFQPKQKQSPKGVSFHLYGQEIDPLENRRTDPTACGNVTSGPVSWAPAREASLEIGASPLGVRAALHENAGQGGLWGNRIRSRLLWTPAWESRTIHRGQEEPAAVLLRTGTPQVGERVWLSRGKSIGVLSWHGRKSGASDGADEE